MQAISLRMSCCTSICVVESVTQLSSSDFLVSEVPHQYEHADCAEFITVYSVCFLKVLMLYYVIWLTFSLDFFPNAPER